MDKDLQEQKKLLEEQLERCRKQDSILAKIEKNLYEMRALAEYARDHKLTALQITELNGQLDELKREVHSLEQQLQSIVQ